MNFTMPGLGPFELSRHALQVNEQWSRRSWHQLRPCVPSQRLHPEARGCMALHARQLESHSCMHAVVNKWYGHIQTIVAYRVVYHSRFGQVKNGAGVILQRHCRK